MKKKIKEKFYQLTKYICHKEKYESQFLRAVDNELFDFAVILIWKTFMLFLYEKIYQISRLIGNKVFLQKWQGRFNNKKPKNYKKENLYWPNEENDDIILSFLGTLYFIDSNFITRLRNRKRERDIASHVSELEFKEIQIEPYLSDLLEVVEKIQQCHIKEYFKDIEEVDKFLEIDTSQKDKEKFLYRLIENLRNASSFNSAQKYENDILKLKNSLAVDHIEKILDGVFENPQPYGINQILEADATSYFLKDIFELKKVPIEKWKKFYQTLKEQEFRRTTKAMLDIYGWFPEEVKCEKEEINIDDIPF